MNVQKKIDIYFIRVFEESIFKMLFFNIPGPKDPQLWSSAANSSRMYWVVGNEYPTPAAPTLCPFPPPFNPVVKGEVAGWASSL